MSWQPSRMQLVLVGTVVVLLAASAYYGWDARRAADQRVRLETQVATLQPPVVPLQVPPATVHDAALAEGFAFPKDLPGLEIIDLVIRSATEANVEVAGLRTAAPGIEQIGINRHRSTRIALRLRATPQNLQSFLIVYAQPG